MVAPRAPRTANAHSRAFYYLNAEVVAAAELILSFRNTRTAHWIWKEELKPRLPRSLARLLQAVDAADDEQSAASWHLHLAKQGMSPVGTCPGRRSVEAAQKRRDRRIPGTAGAPDRPRARRPAAASSGVLQRGRARS